MSLTEEITRQNPWWRGKEIKDETIERGIEQDIISELSEDIVTAITGLRRSGKTTLIKRIIKHLLTKNNHPLKNLMYFSFDIEKVEVDQLLKTYFTEILRVPPEDADQTFIFLDEVQKIDNWSDHVKAYHDSYKNIKFLITGSSSANIRKGGGESLVGRMSTKYLTTFTFREYLRYHDIKLPKKEFGDFSIPVNDSEIKTKFLEYLETGGFPGLISLDETTRIERLKDIIDLTLFRDVVEIFEIQRPELLQGIFRSLSANSGSIVNYDKISKNHDAQYKTVKKYIEELEQSFLIEVSRRYENNVFKEYRKRPKIYSSDHSFCILENTDQGHIAETLAYNHIKTMGETGYWRKNKNEVDIVLKKNDDIYGCEIKYKNKIRESDKRGLKNFIGEFSKSKNYMLTKDELDREGPIKMIPLWLFLLHI